MAHIGLIKALQEHGLEAGAIAGTSVGALVGALYAQGHTVEDMLRFFKETPLFQYNFFSITKPGFIDSDRYVDLFLRFFPSDSFGALKRKLFVVTTDLLNGEEKCFSSGELIRPLLASAALPPVFSPVEITNGYYADGGIMNNFPKEYLEDQVEFILGSNVSYNVKLTKKDLRNSLQLTTRATGLMVYAHCRHKILECDLYIEPKELEHIGVLDKKGIEMAYAMGYDHGMRALESKLSIS